MDETEGVCKHCNQPLTVIEETSEYRFSRCENPDCKTHNHRLELANELVERFAAAGLTPKFDIATNEPFPDGRWVRPSA